MSESSKHSSPIDSRFIKLKTGIDPSKVCVIAGTIRTEILDKGYKLERTQAFIEIDSIDGVGISKSRYPCTTESFEINPGLSGEFFGYLEISAKGAREPSEYAISKKVPQFEVLIMNSPDFKIEMIIHLLGVVTESREYD